MPFPIEEKFVVAVASSALFNLEESDKVFKDKGEEEYRQYQHNHEQDVLEPGVAFPLIKRLLMINGDDPADQPVEVVLLSRNDPDTGLRVFKSIQHYGLSITRAAFVAGSNPFIYMNAFNASLFLSADPNDVRSAIEMGLPAAQVFPTGFVDDEKELELRIAFDFDGIIADDSAEGIYQALGMEGFHENERQKASEALPPGPLFKFFGEVATLQRREWKKKQKDNSYSPRVRIAIVTARNAPAHERVVTTLRTLGILVDEAFFLGGIEKGRVLKVFRPHIFFDDQVGHIEGVSSVSPTAHVPFGVANKVNSLTPPPQTS
ncbi:5'-nucleotidase [Paenibacillus sp. FSL A5-0031]|uniref:5'-nucleotidase n=1 Tax=Paenibacillus sp. FSL A5-0031 TaxID=1920420 RepID=UPI00096C2D45|nr:5'-nucleotidase [Paenibacillus sp. FSL A5-0031]OME76918.1 5'-nucleotidase [Paenibacillus sp. FSL A5-0031]